MPGEDEKFKGEHYEKIRWEVTLPPPPAPDSPAHGRPTTHWMPLPLKLRPGLATRVHWVLHDWPLRRHLGGGKLLARGTVPLTVAESLAAVQAVGGVRTTHPQNRSAHLEHFLPSAAAPQPFLASGFFANWGGWMAKDLEGGAVGQTVRAAATPSAPFRARSF